MSLDPAVSKRSAGSVWQVSFVSRHRAGVDTWDALQH